jgi:hypothetical protein
MTIEERVMNVLSWINEDTLSNNYKGLSIFVRLDEKGYLIGCRGDQMKDKKGNGIPTYELTSLDIKHTREKTIAHMKEKLQKENEIFKKSLRFSYEEYLKRQESTVGKTDSEKEK